MFSRTQDISIAEKDLITIHYLEAQGKAYLEGESPTLLMVHGLGANANIWAPMVKGLIAEAPHLRCVALDLPNHGQSGTVACPDMHQLIAAIHQFIEVLDLQDVHLVGHSFGASLLMHSNKNPLHTRRIKQYHILSPVGIQPMTAMQKRFIKSVYNVDFLLKMGKTGSYESFKKYFVQYTPSYDTIWEQIAPDIDRSPRGYFESVQALATSVIDDYELNDMTIFENIQFIIGRNDLVVPYKALDRRVTIEQLRDQNRMAYFPNSKWELLDNCGHYPQLEHKNQVVELILEAI